MVKSLKLFGILAIAAFLSALAAVLFWPLAMDWPAMPMKVPLVRNDLLPVSYIANWYTISPVAFIGSFVASYIFLKRGQRTWAWSIIYIVLCDAFAVLTFSLVVLCLGLYDILTSPWHTSGNLRVVSVVGDGFLVFLVPLVSVSLGNVATKGVGFIMAIPALLWLWFFAPAEKSTRGGTQA